MEKLEQSHPVEIVWRSFELRPKDGPPPSPAYLEKVQAGRPRIYTIAREQYSLEMKPGPFGFDSRPALIGAKIAESVGVGAQFHRRVMQAYWQEEQDIADEAVLCDIAIYSGMDGEVFKANLLKSEFQQAVFNDIEQAQLYGLSGVPAMIFANQYLVSGAQPYQVLVQAVEQMLQEMKG